MPQMYPNTTYARSPFTVDPDTAVVYISGPMTGYEDDNFKEFNRVEAQLKQWGIKQVINPAKGGHSNGRTWNELLRGDLVQMLLAKVTHVVVLENWEDSRGSKLEVHVARELNIPILNEYLGFYQGNILDEAKRAVLGPRQLLYGHPMTDMERTAGMWNGLFKQKLASYQSFVAEDVAKAMILVKLSRSMNLTHRDNFVDIAGYAQCLQMIADERQRRLEETWSAHFPSIGDLGCECPQCMDESGLEEMDDPAECDCTQCDGTHNVANEADEPELCVP